MNQNSKTNCESQAGSTNYEGQNMGTNYNNQGTNYNNQGPNYNNQGTNYNNQGPNYNYQSSGPNYSGPGVTPLKTDRGLLGYIVLSILTCGIYSYYFIYTVARDVNTACAGDGKSTGGLVQFILLSTSLAEFTVGGGSILSETALQQTHLVTVCHLQKTVLLFYYGFSLALSSVSSDRLLQ